MSDDLFDLLEQQGVSFGAEARKQITESLQRRLRYRPRIGVFGKTGAGKSSLCNALFGKAVCLVDDVSTCTRAPQEVLLEIGGGLSLLDVPGVGEASERDRKYEALYQELVPSLDAVLWLLKADDRAYSIDRRLFASHIRPLDKPTLLVINQVDKIEPFQEWNERKHRPGARQKRNVAAKIKAIATSFEVPIGDVLPVSASEGFQLVELLDALIMRLPDEQKLVLASELEERREDEAVLSVEAQQDVDEAARKIVQKAIEDSEASDEARENFNMFTLAESFVDLTRTTINAFMPFRWP